MRAARVLALSLALSLAGCGSTLQGGRVKQGKLKLYDGPTRPREETVTVRCDRCGFFAVDGRTITGSKDRTVRFGRSVTLLPGRHVFDVELPAERLGACSGSTSSAELAADVRAGRSYVVRTVVECEAATMDYEFWLWMEDETSGEVVSGEPPA